MAIVTYNRRDLEKLVGKALPDQALQKAAAMGAPLEAISKGEASFEVFPNRPDLLSAEGFARAFRTFIFGPKRRGYSIKPSLIRIKVDKSVLPVRPFIAGAVVKNVQMDDAFLSSLMQFQEKIHDTVGRRRRKVSIGIYDISKVTPPFTYKAVAPNSVSFVPLDLPSELTLGQILDEHPKGREYAFILQDNKSYPLLVDSEGKVLSFPPIINSEQTRVEPGTSQLFIDITGTDLAAVSQALNILTCAFIDRDSKVYSVFVDNRKTPDLSPATMKLDAQYCNKLLGLSLSSAQISRLLKKMGFEVTKLNPLTVKIPPYRADILHPIDLVEDVAIAHGYMEFSPHISETATIGSKLPTQKLIGKVRRIMLGYGFTETESFVLSNQNTQFKKMNLKEGELVTISNPRTSEYTHFRNSLLPSILEVIRTNARYEIPQSFFTIGYVSHYEKGQAKTELTLAAATVSDQASYSNMRSYIESFLSEFQEKKPKIEKITHPSFMEGRASRLASEKLSFTLGELHPSTLKNFGVEYPVACFETSLEKLKDAS